MIFRCFVAHTTTDKMAARSRKIGIIGAQSTGVISAYMLEFSTIKRPFSSIWGEIWKFEPAPYRARLAFEAFLNQPNEDYARTSSRCKKKKNERRFFSSSWNETKIENEMRGRHSWISCQKPLKILSRFDLREVLGISDLPRSGKTRHWKANSFWSRMIAFSLWVAAEHEIIRLRFHLNSGRFSFAVRKKTTKSRSDYKIPAAFFPNLTLSLAMKCSFIDAKKRKKKYAWKRSRIFGS